MGGKEIRLPPCVISPTACQKEYWKAGGILPCDLWDKNNCRPEKLIREGSDRNSTLHYNCPISFLMTPLTPKENEMKRRFLYLVSGYAMFAPEEESV
jgi:hypothetical protein